MRQHLKNILNDIEDFTKSHIVLKTYYDNILVDMGNINVMYPILYVEQGNVKINDGVIQINMTIYVTDLLNHDKSNFIDILDNMLLCAIDVRDYFRLKETNCEWFIEPSATLIPNRFKITNEESAGYQFDCVVKIKHNTDKNQIPIG